MELTINDYPLFYIIWNTILGIIPFFLCFWMFKVSQKSGVLNVVFLFALFLLWLVFLPNSPYIITDVRHINGFCPNTILDNCLDGSWMIMFFFTYGLWGLVLHFYTMEQMVIFLRRRVSKYISLIFPLLVSPIIAIGILLGLVNRFNTWDLLHNLDKVLLVTYSYFTTAEGLRGISVFSISLILYYYIAKLLFKPIEKIKILNKLIR